MKNKYKIIIFLFLIVGIIYLISTTFADYVSTASGMGKVEVAKWHVAVGGVDISSSNMHDISTEIEMVPEDLDEVMDGKIVPESKLVGTFTIDPLDTEVDIEYTITIGEFSCVGETEYTPNIEITGVTANGDIVSLDEENKFSGRIDLGSGVVEVNIYAKWNSSEQDYLIGENIQQIQLPINVYIEQSAKKWIKIIDLFKKNKLNIGDFVTYDAGAWTEEEIDNIEIGLASSPVKPNNSTVLPTSKFQFGGFTVGMSRNEGAIEYNNTKYMYAKMYDDGDSNSKVSISGWRIWDIDEENGVITLVSAANPEDYYHINETNGSYIAQYILTETKNEKWNGNLSDYKIRDFSMYENSKYGARNAKILNETDLVAWYNKYLGSNDVFIGIYSEPNIKYQNLIDNHSYYWLGLPHDEASSSNVNSGTRGVNKSANRAMGVRILVSIPLDSAVKLEPIAQRTVTLEGMSYYAGTYGPETIQTYNVWELK